MSKADLTSVVVLDDIHAPQLTCETCGDKGRVVEDTRGGYYVCNSCSAIVGDQVIAEGSEWRTFGDAEPGRSKDDPARVGGPESALMQEIGLSTVIGSVTGDANNPLSKFQTRDSLDSHHRTLLEAFRKIQVVAGRLSLPQSVITKAQELYKRVVDSKELKHRKGEALQAVCLYMSWKLAGVARTIKELCNATGVPKRDVSRLYTKIKKLKLYKKSGGTGGKKEKKTKVESLPQSAIFMDRFCSQLALPRFVANAATEIVKRVATLGLLEGKQPQTIAGSAIFMVCQLAPAYQKTFQEIGDITSMAAGTLRQAYHILHASRMELVPTESFLPSVVQNLQANPPNS